MKPVLFSILAVVFVTALYWLGGFDFNERGIILWSWAMYSALAAGSAYFFVKSF